MVDPRLPLELERKIFLTSLQDDFNQVGSLTLVAKRVHEWIIPEAFKVVIIYANETEFPVVFDLDKFRRYGTYIRSLLLIAHHDQEGHVPEWLSLCPNVTDLWISTPYLPFVLTAIANLPLTRLWVSLEDLLPATMPQDPPVFLHVTHLRTSCIPRHLTTSLQTLLPNLTHLAVSFIQDADTHRLALHNLDRLQVFMICASRGGETLEEMSIREEHYAGSHAQCLVIEGSSYLTNWEQGQRGRGTDIWEFAEEIIRLRRASDSVSRVGV